MPMSIDSLQMILHYAGHRNRNKNSTVSIRGILIFKKFVDQDEINYVIDILAAPRKLLPAKLSFLCNKNTHQKDSMMQAVSVWQYISLKSGITSKLQSKTQISIVWDFLLVQHNVLFATIFFNKFSHLHLCFKHCCLRMLTPLQRLLKPEGTF